MAVLYENPKAGFGGEATIRKSALNPLARSSLDQQIDVLRLARMGVPKCIDLWRGFERECPGEARMVANAVGIIKAENRGAEKQVGKVLRKTETKAGRKVRQPPELPWYQAPTPVTKRQMWTDTQLVRSAFWHELRDPDPRVRALAERAIAEIDRGELAC